MAYSTGKYSVALGPGVVAARDYEVVIGPQLYCTDPVALAWWNSPRCEHTMRVHSRAHSAEDYARMVAWMEKYFGCELLFKNKSNI